MWWAGSCCCFRRRPCLVRLLGCRPHHGMVPVHPGPLLLQMMQEVEGPCPALDRAPVNEEEELGHWASLLLLLLLMGRRVLEGPPRAGLLEGGHCRLQQAPTM